MVEVGLEEVDRRREGCFSSFGRGGRGGGGVGSVDVVGQGVVHIFFLHRQYQKHTNAENPNILVRYVVQNGGRNLSGKRQLQ